MPACAQSAITTVPEPECFPLLGRHYQFLPIALALVCLLSTWRFAIGIGAVGLGANAPTVQQGLLPLLIGCRKILHGQSPYRPLVTQQIQTAIYGSPHEGLGNQQRFAYPVYSAVLFAPLALLPFAVARIVALVGCVAALAASLRLCPLARHRRALGVITVLTFATYPAVLGLQLCQPTILAVASLALVLYWVRSGHLRAAGMLGAVSCFKPQLAVAVLLPLAIWTATDWNARKRFLLSLAYTLGALLLVAEIMVPGWFAEWLATLRAYAQYAGAKPLLFDLVGARAAIPAACIVLASVIWISFRFCPRDLLFAVSFSIAAFQLLFPFLLYNELLLLPAALWLLDNGAGIRARGQMPSLLWYATWIVLASGWLSSVALVMWDLAAPGAAATLWPLPLVAAWLYPWTVFLALATVAVTGVRVRELAAA